MCTIAAIACPRSIDKYLHAVLKRRGLRRQRESHVQPQQKRHTHIAKSKSMGSDSNRSSSISSSGVGSTGS